MVIARPYVCGIRGSAMTVHNVIIIGSGPAGLTAAIYAARANLKPLCIEGFMMDGMIPGGQLMITTEVENYPGFPEGITGPELMKHFRDQALRFGTEIITADVDRVDFSSRPFKCWVGDDMYEANSVIVATGASARWLGLESEQAFQGHGVSACATCDGFFFRTRRVAVVGGGNTAAEEALYLAKLCEHVTLVHRRDELRAEKVLQERVFRAKNITIEWNHVVDEVLGGGEPKAVTGVRLAHATIGVTKEIALEGVFIAIGHSPATELFAGQLEVDREGYLMTRPDSTATAIPGVFAAGDVQDRIYRQAVTAAGTGCMAALEAERFLAERDDG